MSDSEDRGRLRVPAEDRPGPPPELRSVGSGRSRALGAFLATFALVAFAGVVWYAYDRGLHAGSESTAPVIRADSRPVKIRPEQPGGMDIPNQDKLVFDALRPEEDKLPRVERLLPPPEAPAPPPEMPAIETPAVEIPAIETPPIETPVEPADTRIPPARIVTPAPAPVIPQPDQTPAPEAPAETPADSPSVTRSAPQVAEAPAVAAAPPPTAPEPAAPEPKPTPSPQAQPEQVSKPVPAAEPKAPAAGAYRIQLAAVRSEEVAASEWNRLKRRYSDVLGALTPHYQRIDLGASKGVFYRVQGGDVSRSAAQDICARLKAQEQACLVINP